jgi:hypothetical protein
MIELLFVACLVSEPDKCQNKALQFSDISPMQCMMGAQPQLAQWTNQNPKWHVKNWKCQTVNFAERDA